jgi:periplasmic divalent cation tolerance protein
MKYIAIFITTKNRAEADKIGALLVEHKLAACANIIDGVRSIFSWKGAVQESREALVMIKTRAVLFPKIAAFVRRHHSYQVPEIIALPIQKGSKDYLRWISDSTKSR